jgi:hypothetical protein
VLLWTPTILTQKYPIYLAIYSLFHGQLRNYCHIEVN